MTTAATNDNLQNADLVERFKVQWERAMGLPAAERKAWMLSALDFMREQIAAEGD